MLYCVDPPQFLDPTEFVGQLVVRLPINLRPYPKKGNHQPIVQYINTGINRDAKEIKPFKKEGSIWSFFNLSPEPTVRPNSIMDHYYLCGWMDMAVYLPHQKFVKIILRDTYEEEYVKRHMILDSQDSMIEVALDKIPHKP